MIALLPHQGVMMPWDTGEPEKGDRELAGSIPILEELPVIEIQARAVRFSGGSH